MKRLIKGMRQNRRGSRVWRRVSTVLAVLVVFVMTYTLILPAITLEQSQAAGMSGIDAGASEEKVLNCPVRVHDHTDDCYRKVPIYDKNGRRTGTKVTRICGYTDKVAHTHDKNCYQTVTRTVVEDGVEKTVTEEKLVCQLPEIEEHVHTDECYDDQGNLICGKEELPVHQHTEACFSAPEEAEAGREKLDEADGSDGEGAEMQTVTGGDQGDVDVQTEDSEGTAAGDPDSQTPAEAGQTEDGELLPEGGQEAGSAEDGELLPEEEADGTETDGTEPGSAEADGTEPAVTGNETGEEESGEPESGPGSSNWYTTDESSENAAGDAEDTDNDISRAGDTDSQTGETEPGAGDESGEDAELSTEEGSETYVLFQNTVNVEGTSLRVTVSYDNTSGIPEDARFRAVALTRKNAAYETFREMAVEAVAADQGDQEDAGQQVLSLFDLSVYDAEGNVLQPASPLTISVEFGGAVGQVQSEIYAVHFPGTDINGKAGADGAARSSYAQAFAERLGRSTLFGGKTTGAAGDADDTAGGSAGTSAAVTDPVEALSGTEAEVLVTDFDGSTTDTITFQSDGLSVYAIVEAPEPATTEIQSVTSLDELADGTAFYLSYNGTAIYVGSNLNSNSCFIEVGETASAAEWYFEPVEGGSPDQFYIYTLIDGYRQYIRNTSGNLVGLDSQNPTSFTLSVPETGKFLLKSTTENKWLQHSNGGGGIRFYTDANNATNSRFTITYVSSYSLEKDPYGLDGKTYGLAYNDNSAKAAALMAEEKTVGEAQRLAGTDLLIRPDVLNNEGNLLMAQNSDVSEWTFEAVEGDQYYIKTTVGGTTKYLTIDGANLTLEDEPDETKSLISATPGTGENSGKWHFTAGGYSLNLSGSAGNGFNAVKGTGATTWLNLVEKSVLDDDDFNLYTAKKVSVSDTDNLYDGQKVIVYTRIWNDTTKRYEFYAVDHDGSLVRCYDTGDNIEWIGSQVNTALWDFTEYFNTDGTPNYYYELQNDQYKNYIAPQVTGGQILSNKTIGINLNGRRYGENYSTIIAWDDSNYAYVGLKTENGRIVACPLSEAEDFYFAIVNPAEEEDDLTTVDTVDSDAYGISMKMVDFNNSLLNNRDSEQSPFFNGDNNTAGLLSTDLDEDGYPRTTEKTGSEKPLSQLFTGMTDVNHLFIQSIYNESGYFEYDSTQNFAHLNADGTFKVYDQLGAIGDNQGVNGTGLHGQFMPYDDLTPGKYCSFTNQTDVLANELSDVDPRKGEKLYNIGNKKDVDYFFGMEMSASFTQTASGLDAWGHDIIFEFSGDDDFWFYVDGELVLDLGGVHSAMAGSINFRTGVVKSSRGDSTLYEIFKKNYKARNPEKTSEEVTAYLDEIFEKNSDGNYVFKDYSNHEMKMFYMERGAGSSNLHMRFNLAAVKPGTFILSKNLSGTEMADNDLIEFPYQIYYTTKADGGSQYHLLSEKTGNTYNALYKGTTSHVKYLDEFTPAGGTEDYQNVFFLKPGQAAEITLPDDVLDYYVVECGVNPDIYDQVKANGVTLAGSDTANTVSGTARQDYTTEAALLKERSEVDFDNHVREGAMRTLSITKRLYDVDGESRLHYPENSTTFSFRLYLGDENADAANLPLANMYDYCVIDPNGNYCKWDAAAQKFVSLGKTDYTSLTDAEKEAATFTTSMNGSISKIPADFTVEVRNLIISSKFKVEERNYEIPRGYTLRSGDGYSRVDAGHEGTTGDVPISGTIEKENDPEIEVRNQKGWGLTAEKVWSDQDFMEAHDDIYFAVYIRQSQTTGGQESTEDILYDGTVRRLAAGETELYYFFDDLKYGQGENEVTYNFTDFVIKEVTLEGSSLVVDDEGRVTGYTAVTPVSDGGTLTIGGTPAGGDHKDGYTYTVEYDVGQATGRNENVRTDTVTNARPGIVLYKTDWSGAYLSEAVFTLKDENGSDVAAASYTSGSSGLITIAYLNPGVYTLTETAAPKGYVVLQSPMTITVGDDDSVTVSGVSEEYYSIDTETDDGMTAAITIKNRPAALQVKKTDASTQAAIAGVHFALYKQVTATDGTVRRDYLPLAGFEDISTDNNGILEEVTMELPADTYYLEEIQAAGGYNKLEQDLCFTIGNDGTVTVNSEGHSGWLRTETDETTGQTSYTITIPNEKMNRVSFRKVDTADPASAALAGAKFDLYRVSEDGVREETPLFKDMISGEDGLLVYSTETVFELEAGIYHLIETEAPAGYIIKSDPVIIRVLGTDVTYDEGTALSQSGAGKSKKGEIYTLKISNTSGYELPASGGAGTGIFTILGSMLLAFAVGGLLMKKRNRTVA